MRRRIFYRFFAVTLLSTILMFAFGIVAVNLNTRSVINTRLCEEAELAGALLRDGDGIDALKKYNGGDEMRITVIDTEGNVLYESDTTAELENHKDREEIAGALAGEPRTVRRYSETFGCDMTYYAVMVTLDNGSDVVLRLAVRSSHITSYISALIPLLVLVLGITLTVSLLLSGILSRSISDKVNEIGRSLSSLNSGKYEPIKTDMSEPELYTILSEINELNANIHSHIRAADGERVKLNAVLDNVSQSIIAIDKTGRVAFANKCAFATFGGSTHDIGRDIVFLIENLDVCERIKKHDGNTVFECSYRERELAVAISDVCDESIGDDIASIIIVTDVTNERLMAKQKSDFFANASHELKTPITVIRGLSEVMLGKNVEDDGARKQLTRMYKESCRLGTLISDMLMLSKIENRQTAVEIAPLRLKDIVEECCSELEEQTTERGIKTEITGDAQITADRGMIYELVENLVSNAVKYNKDGGSVRISVEETESGATLTVSDTGIGIEKEHLPRLCERFYRVDKSHSKRIGGTGLGLAIVKHICSSMGAELNIESEFGVGTTVTVRFPTEISQGDSLNSTSVEQDRSE